MTIEQKGAILFDMRTQVSKPVDDATAARPGQDLAMILSSALKSWWEAESEDWDALVTGTTPDRAGEEDDLWNDMPVLDSKAVARTSPLFERYLGIPLDIRLIRPGGYDGIQEMIDDIVPKMIVAARGDHPN